MFEFGDEDWGIGWTGAERSRLDRFELRGDGNASGPGDVMRDSDVKVATILHVSRVTAVSVL
jgi:hypothetical protein